MCIFTEMDECIPSNENWDDIQDDPKFYVRKFVSLICKFKLTQNLKKIYEMVKFFNWYQI